jgi:DNA-binding MarR family transcriptional regulator
MSWNHVRLVIEHSKTKGPNRAIMLALAFRASKDDRPRDHIREGECYPSLKTIADDAGLQRSTVAERLPGLERMGEIVIVRRGYKQHDGRSNLYRITLSPPGSVSPPDGLTGKTDSPPRGLTDKADSPPDGRQIVRHADGSLSATRTSVSPPRGPKPLEKEKSEPSMNRKRRTAGLPGHRIDYQTAEVPSIEGDGHAVIHNCPDPIIAAMAVTGERQKKGWGHWVKVLNRARRDYGSERAERLFRDCLEQLHAEMEAGEVRNPGAILNVKLKRYFALHEPCQTPGAAIWRTWPISRTRPEPGDERQEGQGAENRAGTNR